MVRIRSRASWTAAARSTATLAAGLAVFMLLGAVGAAVLEPPWLFVSRSFMRAILFMDVVVGVLVGAAAIHMFGVGAGLLPVAKCSRLGDGVVLALTTGGEPLNRSRAALVAGRATVTRERRRNDRGLESTIVRIKQESSHSSLATPFAVSDQVLAEIATFATANGVTLELGRGDSGEQPRSKLER